MASNKPGHREKLLDDSQKTFWDIIIVGGGITGAGILREASRNGLKALLVEQKDFGWGTSSRSSKMVHGGLRYLKEGNLSLTFQSVREKKNLIKELPGLVDDNHFFFPLYDTGKAQMLFIRTGLFLYDLMAGKIKRRYFPAKFFTGAVTGIKQTLLSGGFVLNDAVTDDARLVLRVLAEAAKDGGLALNYCKVTRLLKEEGKVRGVVIQDPERGTSHCLRAGLVINATGAWANKLRSQVKRKNKLRVRALRGSHLILDTKTLPLKNNLLFNHPKDDRPLIALNWEGRVLVGTTDLDHKDDLDKEAGISPGEVEYFLEALAYQFPQYNIGEKQIISTLAGVRPVIDSGKANPSQESRDHAIWVEDGLISVTGGKLTTFRIMAMDVLKAAGKQIRPIKGIGKKRPIFSKPQQILKREDSIGEDHLRRIQGRYGSLANQFLTTAKKDELEAISGTNTLWAELRWGLRHESVVHLEDLMLRRTRLGLLLEDGGKKILPRVKKIWVDELGFKAHLWDKEARDYLNLWKQSYDVPPKMISQKGH